MLPSIINRRIEYARAVADTLREVARECTNQPGASARFTQAAQTIDELIALLEAQTAVAKWNHDTILGRAEA